MNDHIPKNIIYLPNIINLELEKEALLELDNYQKWNPIQGKRYKGTKDMRLGFGRHHQLPIPEIFNKISQKAIQIFSEKNPELFSEKVEFKYFTPETLVINKYNIGDKCGAHHDPPRENPLVIGITIGNSRKMRWRNDKNKNIKYDIITEPRSLYAFWGDAFNNWTHESVASKKQKGTLYSLTFRKHRANIN